VHENNSRPQSIATTQKPVRVRFAPSPTGNMHIGNARTALLNYLFARQTGGTFIIRIEDTDAQRNFDPEAHGILKVLSWLGLDYQEGPIKGGPHSPYFQSQRFSLYQKKLDELIKNKSVYRCFCSTEDLEKKRQRQLALKQPPRYDKTCLKLSQEEIDAKVAAGCPFIWRFAIDQTQNLSFADMGHGQMKFDLANFSDFPLTRQDGSFTFIFANLIDDIDMNITHIFRGDDHLSNTVTQVLLYQAFNAPIPTFWHLPILCNTEGKKLSKRDFGFAVEDLRREGFLPEAITNYLAIIGGSYEQEIMNLDQLATAFKFDHISSAGLIKYDPEKLHWVNHKWIASLPPETILDRCMSIISEEYVEAQSFDRETLVKLIKVIQPDLITLRHCIPATRFFFISPSVTREMLSSQFADVDTEKFITILSENVQLISTPEQFISTIKTAGQKEKIATSALMRMLRTVLIGTPQGPSIHDIIDILGSKEAKQRIQNFLK
jgi:glutamyl-tRNA synthetase